MHVMRSVQSRGYEAQASSTRPISPMSRCRMLRTISHKETEMQKAKKCFVVVSLFLSMLVTSQAAVAACFGVYVSTNSDELIGEIVTVSLFDSNTKKLAQSWQLQIAKKKPKHYSECAEDGEYIIRYSGMGMGMAWQEYHNLLINGSTKLRVHMKPGDDGRVLIVSEPYEVSR